MRILWVPQALGVNLAGDSYINIVRDLITYLNDAEGDVWHYVILPKRYDGSVFEKLRSTTVVYEDAPIYDFYREMQRVPDLTAFSMNRGIYPIDVVVNMKIGCSLQIFRLMNRIDMSELDGLQMPLVNLEPRAMGVRATYHVLNVYEHFARACSYACFKSLLTNVDDFEDILETSRPYLSESMIKRLKSNFVEIYWAPELVKLDEDVKKREKFTCFFGGRITADKRVDLVMKTYLQMFEAGRDIDIVMTTSSVSSKLPGIKEMLRNKKIEVMYGVPREEYLRIAASCHVFMNAQKRGSTSLAVLEMLNLGLPCILPRIKANVAVLGNDYKLFFDNDVEAATLLRWVYDNYEEALAIAADARERMLKWVAVTKPMVMVAETLRSEYEDKTVSRFKDAKIMQGETRRIADSVAQKVREEGGATLYEIVGEYKKYFKSRLDDVRGRPSLWELHQFLKISGFRDLCDSPVPTYRWGGDE